MTGPELRRRKEALKVKPREFARLLIKRQDYIRAVEGRERVPTRFERQYLEVLERLERECKLPEEARVFQEEAA